MDGPQTYVLATTLTQQLCGVPVDHLTVPTGRWQANVLLMHCAGQVIQRITSHGKWLIFDFSHGVSWACCLLAKSHWEIQSPPKPAPPSDKPASGRDPLLVVHLRHGTTVTLRGRPLFLTLSTETLWHHAELRDLGPNPLADWDPSQPAAIPQPAPKFTELFLARLRQAPQRTLASALLDQQIVAGLGNPLKCEILFDLHLAPATRVGALFASHLEQVAAAVLSRTRAATAQLLAESETLTPPVPSQVYDRAGESCLACSQPIEVDRSGADGRWSWHCPHCQKILTGPTLF